MGEGLHIIQTFEPHPLYAVMEGLGYEHHTEQRGEAEFHVWFCRVEKKVGDSSAPFKPLALLNYPMIDESWGRSPWILGDHMAEREARTALRNAAAAVPDQRSGRRPDAAGGARAGKSIYPRRGERRSGRCVRAAGMESGHRFFSSEIGPSALFQAYKLIKNGEKQGKSREDICSALREKFGEKNPEMQVLH